MLDLVLEANHFLLEDKALFAGLFGRLMSLNELLLDLSQLLVEYSQAFLCFLGL